MVTGLKTTGNVLEKGSQYVAVTLVKGAVMLGKGIHSGGAYIMKKIKPKVISSCYCDDTTGATYSC